MSERGLVQVFVDDGRILDEGSYTELIGKNALFRRMVEAARTEK